MKKYIFLSMLALWLSTGLSIAQLWNKSFEKEVNFIKMTEAGIAVVGTDDALYGIDKEGNIRWQNEKLRKIEANRVEVLNGSELIFVSDKGLTARNRTINVLTGFEYADTGVKFENIFGATIVHPTNTLLVMPEPDKIDAWDISSNQKIWSIGGHIPFGIATQKSAALTATFQGMQPITYTSDHTGIMHLGLGHLAEYDFRTGQTRWQFDFKPYKLKKPGNGKGDKPSNPANGFGVMKLDAATQTLYFPFRDILMAVDAKTGQAKWDPKANQTGQVRDLHIIPEGILVLKLNGLQLIDPATGAEKWKKPLKVKGAESGLLVRDGETFYLVSNKYLLEVDIAGKSVRQLSDKIKFDGGESFSQIEMMGELIVLSSSQNVVGVNKQSGEITYQRYFKAPNASLLTVAQNVALAAVAVAATMNSQRLGQQNADARGNYSHFQYTPAMMDAGVNNTRMSKEFMYINTRFKGSGFGLAKVDKKSGQLVEEIIIGDRSPIYAQDEAARLIYYKSDKTGIACRAMN